MAQDQFPQLSTTDQLRNSHNGLRTGAALIGQELIAQAAEVNVSHFSEMQYPEGTTQVEIHEGIGHKFEWEKYKHNGGVGERTDRSTGLKTPLTGPPTKEGRVGVIFDNGKSMVVQDGVAYVFGFDADTGESRLLKEVAVEEVSDVLVGSRDSVSLHSFVDEEKREASVTNIDGRVMRVIVEAHNPDLS